MNKGEILLFMECIPGCEEANEITLHKWLSSGTEDDVYTDLKKSFS